MKRLEICLLFVLFLALFVFSSNSVGAETPKRVYGSDRIETSIKISQEGWKQADTVFLSTSSNFPDALAGAPLAYKYDAPILLSLKDNIREDIKKEVIRLGAKRVILLGGKAVLSDTLKNNLENLGLEVRRIGGANRYETATLIAKELGSESKLAYLVYGGNFPDALALSPRAASSGTPILLTQTNTLPNTTKKFLKENEIQSLTIIGGNGVISNKIETELNNVIKINTARLDGEDRYETAQKIVRYGFCEQEKGIVARGDHFADALTGGVFAAKTNAVMFLVKPNAMPESSLSSMKVTCQNVKNFTVLGGKNAISDLVVNTIDATYLSSTESLKELI
ncbi:cell wall-binding repeat-containing protein [Bacillus timonensis]|uniref:cell wall-binding repeat-containing protein n=1 Tax=Bacillus timonensis TaxID=1033734 RepID=UPI000288CBE2|nr:cell wall-binding repeat-containing protein [Bacillus timonensis]